MDDIVPDALFAGKVFDTLHELWDVIRQFLFRDRMLGTCRHMDNAVAITKLVQHMRHVIILGAREHIHVDAHLSQLPRQFADVDVHPAGILAAQRRQRASVIRDHRNS